MKPVVTLVGAGPGSPELLTIAGFDALQTADVVLHDRLIDPGFFALAPRARWINVGKSPSDSDTQEQINSRLVELALSGERVVRLKGGDPFLYGRGAEEVAELSRHGIAARVIPGLSALTAAPTSADIPLSHRGLASSVGVSVGTNAVSKPNIEMLAKAGTGVVFMGVAGLAQLITDLVNAGVDPSTPAALVSHATWASQKVFRSTLSTLPVNDVPTPALLVFGRVVDALQRHRPAVVFAGTRRTSVSLAAAHDAFDSRAFAILRTERVVAQIDPTGWDEVVFTSATTPEIVRDLLLESGSDLRALASTKLIAIGPATGKALEEVGLRADAIGDGSTRSLIDLVGSSATVGYPRAEDVRGDLATSLRSKGAKLDEVVVYRTLIDELAVERCADTARAADLVVLSSGRAARAWLDATTDVEHRILCVGESAAREAPAADSCSVSELDATLDRILGESV